MSGIARVVKLVDTRDLKSRRFIAVPVRFRPRAPISGPLPNQIARHKHLRTVSYKEYIELYRLIGSI